MTPSSIRAKLATKSTREKRDHLRQDNTGADIKIAEAKDLADDVDMAIGLLEENDKSIDQLSRFAQAAWVLLRRLNPQHLPNPLSDQWLALFDGPGQREVAEVAKEWDRLASIKSTADGEAMLQEAFERGSNWQSQWDSAGGSSGEEYFTLRTEAAADYAESVLTSPALATMPHVAPAEDGLAWAVGRWNAEVKGKQVKNPQRRALDTAWRQVIRYFGGDPDQLVGPSHDALVRPGPEEQ